MCVCVLRGVGWGGVGMVCCLPPITFDAIHFFKKSFLKHHSTFANQNPVASKQHFRSSKVSDQLRIEIKTNLICC